jgi:hypothetical protein
LFKPLIVDHLGLTDLNDVARFKSNIADGEIVDGGSGFGTKIKQVETSIVSAKLDMISGDHRVIQHKIICGTATYVDDWLRQEKSFLVSHDQAGVFGQGFFLRFPG